MATAAAGPGKEPEVIRFSREMGITHAEFFRGLPAALADRPYRRQGHEILLDEGRRRLVITLAPEAQRSLGAMRLPTTSVRFTFSGYTRQEVDCFMARFTLYFQRGGG